MPQVLPAVFGAAGAGAGATAGAMSIGSALQTGGAILGMVAQLSAASANAAIANQNAKIAEQNAKDAILQSQMEAQEADVKAKGEIGAILAQQAGSGVRVGSGSTMLQRKSMDELAAKDRGYIRQEGELEAHAFRQQAADFRYKAKAERSAGMFAALSGISDVGTSLISGANRVQRNRILDIRAGA